MTLLRLDIVNHCTYLTMFYTQQEVIQVYPNYYLHIITEILLKVVLNTINHLNQTESLDSCNKLTSLSLGHGYIFFV
jgi:hypothetical protein